MYAFEIFQDGTVVAQGSGVDDLAVYREACHYFSMYRQDGPCELAFGTADEDGCLKHGSRVPPLPTEQ